MNSTLILEGIEISGHCGLTQDERSHLQPIRIDLEIDCANSQAGETDNIQHTIDYAQIINRLLEIGTCNQFYLVESLAEYTIRTLFEEFPILGLRIWVRKTDPPLKATVNSVGVRLSRDRGSLGNQVYLLSLQTPITLSSRTPTPITERKNSGPCRWTGQKCPVSCQPGLFRYGNRSG